MEHKKHTLKDELPPKDIDYMANNILRRYDDLKAKIENMPCAYFELSSDLKKIYPNWKFRRLIDKTKDEIQEKDFNWKYCVNRKHIDELLLLFNECLKEGKERRVMFQIIGKGGEFRKVIGNIKAIKNSNGTHIAFTSSIQDEEEVRRLFTLISASNDKFKSWKD